MDKCVNDISLPRQEAVEGILRRCRFTPETEWIPAEEAYGRILAEELVSRHNLPNTLASTRDGVAVYYGRFVRGMPDTRGWKKGVDYVFSNTGIGIEGDFDTVIPIEQVSFDEDYQSQFFQCPTEKGQMTAPAGAELAEGELLARAGQTLTPSLLSLLAKGGHTKIPVVRKPVVAFLPTGSELVPPGQELPPRKNVDANSTLIRGKLLEAGAEPRIFPISRDDHSVLYHALKQAVKTADIVLINAGSSKGTNDFTHEILNGMGQILNQQVDTGPGKHTSYTMVGDVPVVGLSGPTVCTDYTFDWYVRPLIDHFLGRPQTRFPKLLARAACDMSSARKWVTLMLGCRVILGDNDIPIVIPAVRLDDNKTIENKVNCFVLLEPGLEIRAGEWVEVELRWPFAAPEREPDTLDITQNAPFLF